MKPESKDVLKEALDLPPIERAALVDELLTSLDKPDEAIDETWRKEIAARLRAYLKGSTLRTICRQSDISREDFLAAYERT